MTVGKRSVLAERKGKEETTPTACEEKEQSQIQTRHSYALKFRLI